MSQTTSVKRITLEIDLPQRFRKEGDPDEGLPVKRTLRYDFSVVFAAQDLLEQSIDDSTAPKERLLTVARLLYAFLHQTDPELSVEDCLSCVGPHNIDYVVGQITSAITVGEGSDGSNPTEGQGPGQPTNSSLTTKAVPVRPPLVLHAANSGTGSKP